MPSAIYNGTDFVPNFYVTTTPNMSGPTFTFDTTNCDNSVILNDNDTIKIITDKEVICTVSNVIVGNNTISFDVLNWASLSDNFVGNVLVYGKLVTDFRHINKNRIFAVGIGAIKHIDTLLSSALNRIDALEAQVADIYRRINS